MSETSQNRYGYPKFRVFIFGVEVTADVVAVNTNQHDGDAPSTCQITLLNEKDKYVITSEDMVALRNLKLPNNTLDIPWMTNITEESVNIEDGDLTASSPIGTTTFASTVKSLFEAGAISRAKRDMLLIKNTAVQNVTKDKLEKSLGINLPGNRFNDYYNTEIEQYPLVDGSPVFHPMDPVRVFMRDPFNPARWYYHFTGFVSDMVDSSDENNTKTLTIVVEDPMKLFRYTRAFINPGIIDAKVVIDQQRDLRLQTFYASAFKGFTLPEVFFTLLFGPDKAGAEKIIQRMRSQSQASNISTKLRGIGHFSFNASGIFSIGPEPGEAKPQSPDQKKTDPETKLMDVKPEIKLKDLIQWQSLIDHEVMPADLYTMLDEGADANGIFAKANEIFSTQGIEGIVQEIGTHPEKYLVDGGRLMMLIPRSLGVENRSVIAKDLTQSSFLNSEWHSVGSILSEVLERIQFVMYASPRGDIIIEPPLYDHNPSNFGLKPISSNEFISSLQSIGVPGDNKDPTAGLIAGEQGAPGTPRGPFGLNYVIRKRDTYRFEMAFVDSKVHNVATCSKSIFKDYDNQPNTSIIGDMVVVPLPHLIPLYGIRQIPLTPRGYITTVAGAKAFCHITLNKLNADAHTIKVEHLPNIKLWLNRPVYMESRNCLGTVKQVSHSLTWGAAGDMGTSTDLFATRFWSGAVSATKADRPIYSTVGGFGASPWNYAVMWGHQDKPRKTTGGRGSGTGSAALDQVSPGANKSVQDSKTKLLDAVSDALKPIKGVK